MLTRESQGFVLFKNFFSSGKLLKEFNTTIITLVPKVSNTSTMGDFRPISCCNTMYKIISKVLANRLKYVLPHIINKSQTTFVHGRRIGDNILLVQELLRNYHRDKGSPRCALKVDLMKAYDMVEWDFILSALAAFNFPPVMINEIHCCISSPKFSISMNGELTGFFASKRGLRQWDPLSPYLFVIAMEVLSLLITSNINASPSFRYHWRCEAVQFAHICFVDDLFMFCGGDYHSAKILKDSLCSFNSLSGLKANLTKSSIFLAGVDEDEHSRIMLLFNFAIGMLPIRYLGVPLISTKLNLQNCSILIERVEARIRAWENKVLSFAGRLQLVQSVLCRMQVFWASHLMLPKKILRDIEQRVRKFLWSGKLFGHCVAKVAWDDVCLPKSEGGLGIKNLIDWNKTCSLM